MITRTALLSSLLLLPLASGCRTPVVDPAATHAIPPFEVAAPIEGQTYQRVVVFGDWGTGRPQQKAVAQAMVDRIKALPGKQIDFMLSTGDNFYPRGVKSVDDPTWQTHFEEIYADPLLQVPVWVTVGNHDYHGSVQALIDYGKRSKRWTMPAIYYSFSKPIGAPAKEGERGQTVEFFCLDTTTLGSSAADPKQQLAWFRKALAASTASWKIVVGHHPMYSHSKRDYNDTLIERLEPLFTKHGVQLYLAGHDHVLELTKPFAGVHHVVSGAAAGPERAYRVSWTDKSYYAATLGGFVLMRVGADDLVLEFVRMNGKTQFAHTLTKQK